MAFQQYLFNKKLDDDDSVSEYILRQIPNFSEEALVPMSGNFDTFKKQKKHLEAKAI